MPLRRSRASTEQASHGCFATERRVAAVSEKRSTCGRRHHVFDVALSRGKLSGSGLVREKASTSDEYSSSEIQYSRTSPLPQNRVPSVGYRLFDKRRLAGDAVDAVCQENRVVVHRRQAASHGPVFAARQRYVEDVVVPPTGYFGVSVSGSRVRRSNFKSGPVQPLNLERNHP